MRSKISEIEDDYIGGQGSLTSAEEKALSEYFKQKKQTKSTIVDKREKIYTC
jgi:hypothetical protein